MVERINAARPDIIWVGLSTPKQERWMAAHVGRLQVPVLVGVGAAFDFHAGVKRRAPRWMQRTGLEWTHRLISEPRRLAGRYLTQAAWLARLLITDGFRRNHACARAEVRQQREPVSPA